MLTCGSSEPRGLGISRKESASTKYVQRSSGSRRLTEQWYNWLTFDIIGDLAFGESFGAVEHSRGHPWVATIKGTIYAAMFADIFRRVPLLKLFPALIRPAKLPAQRKESFRLSREKVERRMEMGNERADFFGHLLSEKASDLSPEFLTGQANTLVVAGSETTATFLEGRIAASR
jgi:cytochrome P450